MSEITTTAPKHDEQERQSRARIPALEAQVAELLTRLDGAHRVQDQLRTELAVTQRIVRSILAGLAGPTE